MVRKAALAWTPLPLRTSTALLRVVIKFWGNLLHSCFSLFRLVKQKVTLTGRLINNIYFPSLEAGKSKVKVLVELESGRSSWVKTEQDRKRWAGVGLGISKTGPPRSTGVPQDGTGQASHATVGSPVVLGGQALKPLGVASTLS